MRLPFMSERCSLQYMEPENSRKKRGRPAIGEGPKLGLRIRPDLDEALDRWISNQDEESLTKPEAIRRLLWKALRDSK